MSNSKRKRSKAPAKGRGRPKELTRDLIQRWENALSQVCYIETAAAFIGKSKDTIYRWLREGERSKGPCLEREFSDATKKGLAMAEVRNATQVQLAAASTWQAAAWFLERRFPERWGRRENVIHGGDVTMRYKMVVANGIPSCVPDDPSPGDGSDGACEG